MSSELRFSVLGPVRAWRSGTELNLGAPQQRAVLAMLLLAGGRQLTLDALINGLWEVDPPSAATGAVRTYVSRLRRTLEGPGDERSARLIESAGTGYFIRADSGLLDLDVFERLVRQARGLRDGGPAERIQAAAMFREAGNLVQGEPLADIPGPNAESQRVRVGELLLTATEERLRLDIGLGGHAAAVAELRALLSAYPIRERMSELLMLALYRSGRQTDALGVFDQVRQALAEDFGIDPGAGLQEMHQRILRMDPGLLLGASASPETGPERVPGQVEVLAPAQLPADLPVFAGRHHELERLDALLDEVDSVAVGVIDGMAGMGKTALAVHWAARVADRFPAGQLYVDLRGFQPGGAAMTAREALRGFLEGLGVAPQSVPDDLEAQASLYRSLLRGRRVLVLLDNAHDVEQVRPLLPGSAGSLVIVTSRNRLLGLMTAHGARSVTLEALSAEEAWQAMAARLDTARMTAEAGAVAEILDCCAGLPLALAIVAARATVYSDLPLHEIARELRDTSTRLDALGSDDATADVRTVFSWSYRLLSEQAQLLFRLLSVHWGPDISRGAVASLAGLSRTRVQPLIAELTGARLITEHRPGRLVAHDLTMVYAAELSTAHDSPEDRHAALGRALEHYLHSGRAAQLRLGPSFWPPEPDPARPGVTPEQPGDYQQAMTWFKNERQVLQMAVGHMAQHGFRSQAWQLALTLQQFLQRQGYWHDWVATMRTGLRAATEAHDTKGQAHMRCSLAGACHLLGRDTEAIAELEQASKLASGADFQGGQGYLHSVFGEIFTTQGSYEEAVEHHRLAYSLYGIAGNRTGQAYALQGTGCCYGHLGRHEEATAKVLDAMHIYRELGDLFGEGDCWLRLGELHHLRAEGEQALACHQRAVVLWRRLGNQGGEALALASLGDSALAARKLDEAREAWQAALIIFSELGLPAASAVRQKLSHLDGLDAACCAPDPSYQ